MPALADLLGPGGALSRALPGYESRAEQLAMAAAVEEALAGARPLLVEAGTGTGKSLAYLVPAARSGLRVVISTATKALGEQLVERDLPMLARLGLRPEVALVKGLSNYVCLRRLEEHRRAVVTGATRGDAYLPKVLNWVEDTESGDRSDLRDVPDDAPAWREVTSSSETRVGAKCRFYEACFVTKMRRRAEAAQIIVTNHHLFCADLALRGGPTGAAALPDYDAVIFDEAHALEEVATEFFGVRITRGRIDTLVRDASRAFEGSGFFVDPTRARSTGALLAGIGAAAAQLFSALPRPQTAQGDLGVAGRAVLRREHLDGPVGDAAKVLDALLKELGASVADFVGQSEALLTVARRVTSIRDSLAQVLLVESTTQVSYCEADARGGGALGCSPIEVGPILSEKLWSRGVPVVLTSATLATGPLPSLSAASQPRVPSGFADATTSTPPVEGDPFVFVRRRLGVPREARTLALPSPFDYGAQSALYVPRKVPEPRDPGYFEAALREIKELVAVTQGGAFVLCTSVRQMRAFADALRGRWPYPTFVQGEIPKQAVLKRFRDAGDGVLFATSSFWEGVDVPGRALRLVIIDKLPFEAPGDPVVAARIARIRELGRDPFVDMQVPVAALALKQGFGRLVRTKRDVGVVAILDRRLVTRGYGRQLMNALPPASRCASVEEVRAFWESVDGADLVREATVGA